MDRKNIVLIIADQFRYDAIGAHGNEYISTPTLNEWSRCGTDFTQAYSATPTCIPARATLLSGLSQVNTGFVGYEEGANWNFPTAMGKVFSDRGYYTKAIGKMHVSPPRNRMGFHHIELHDGYLHATRNSKYNNNKSYGYTDDYLIWLKDKLGNKKDIIDAGLECNSWVSRPFLYEEEYHPTNWVVSRAIDFLRTVDDEPFLLKLSFVRPHSPLDPPEYYFDMYMKMFENIEKEQIQEWCKDLQMCNKIDKVDSLVGELNIYEYRRMLAGYYGSITHIDHQINRFMMSMLEHDLLHDTIFVFTSDHGDQLGDKNLFRKGFPYQESIHIPLIVYDPGNNVVKPEVRKNIINDLVELRDILPSILDFATGEELDNIDGKSIKKLMTTDGDVNWRKYLHGEHILGNFSNQFIIKYPWKYIWFTQKGNEQLFNLSDDPKEKRDLSKYDDYQDILKEMRSILIKELENREEKFVDQGKLKIGVKQRSLLKVNENYKK